MLSGSSLLVKVMWGVVAVEKDGSAHFYVPADRRKQFFFVLSAFFCGR